MLRRLGQILMVFGAIIPKLSSSRATRQSR